MHTKLEPISEVIEDVEDENGEETLCDILIVGNHHGYKKPLVKNLSLKNLVSATIIHEKRSETSDIGGKSGGDGDPDRNGGCDEKTPFLVIDTNSLSVLDEFVRFDLIRTGALCCTGYKVSVQYDDDFMLGKHIDVSTSSSQSQELDHHHHQTLNNNSHNSQTYSCCILSSLSLLQSTKSIQFFSSNSSSPLENETIVELQEFDPETKSYCKNKPSQNGLKSRKNKKFWKELAFLVEYSSVVACWRPHKKRKFTVKVASSTRDEIGWIYTHSDVLLPLEIYLRKGSSYSDTQKLSCRKIRSTAFLIENDDREKMGTIEMFRGLRGDFSSYGVSTIDDSLGPEGKAVLIAAAAALDVEERESELKCTFIWTPAIVVVIILLFSILPWMHYYKNDL